MSKMSELARKYKLPNPSTPEGLEMRWGKVLRFGNRILLAGYSYNKDGKCYFSAVYEFLDDNEQTIEDFIGLREVSEERFEDDGHAIEWALNHK